MRNQKGITLIALIVTIIVLIIIAGISIATLTADNGILRQVDSAKVASIEGQATEEVRLACAAIRLAIAEKQATDNSYKAYANAGKIQATLLSQLKADSQLDKGDDSAWEIQTTVSDAATKSTKFEIVYVGDDYIQATNGTDKTDANIVFEVTLNQSSIELTKVTPSGTHAAGGSVDPIKPSDITA